MQHPILSRSLASLQTDTFNNELKLELAALPPGTLPLQHALSRGGYVDDADVNATILSSSDISEKIVAHVGIFFTEIVICCGCGVDPMPENAYCEMDVIIDKHTASVEFVLLKD